MAKIIEDYVNKTDWRVLENANTGYSFSGLKSYIASSCLAKDSLSKLPAKIRDAHKIGKIHLHDLDGGIGIPYCYGADLQQLMLEGLKNPLGSNSLPCKYFDTLVDHIVNFVYISQSEFNGAQAISNFDTLAAPFVIGKDYTFIKQNLQRLIYNISYPLRSSFQCVSSDTKILTGDGWKYFENLIPTDLVATFNMDNNNIEFLIPDKIIKYDYNGKLIHITNQRTDQLVTPNHRIIKTKTVNRNQQFVFCEAKELLNRKIFCLPISGENNNSDYPISDDKLKLWAWIITEGSIKHKTFVIYQSIKSPYLNEIRLLLTVNGFIWSEKDYPSGFGGSNVIHFRQKSNGTHPGFIKEIPKEFLNLSKRQARLFLDEYRKGDGSKERFRLWCKNYNIVEMLEALCVLAGYGFHTTKKKDGVCIINIIRDFKNKTYIFSGEKYHNQGIEEVDYTGYVWCIHSKNETMITKRNGKIAITGNSPFFNISFDITVPHHMEKEPVVIGGRTHEDLTYGDMQPQMDMINKAFLELMLHGDSQGKPFTFPIPTYGVTKELLEKDDDVTRLLYMLSAKFGNPNFMNYIGSGNNPSDVRALCCRLNLDISKLRSRGLWNMGNRTGSLGVVTLGLNQASINGSDNFIENIDTVYDLAIEELLIKNKYIHESFDKGLLPFTKCYLPNKDPFKTFFHTVGIHGMNEACLNMFDTTIEFNQDFTVEMLKHLRKRVDETTEETGILHNIEESPGEGLTYRLAKLDKKLGLPVQGGDNPYLTNSTHCPVNTIFDWAATVKVQEKFKKWYSGGTIFSGFVGDPVSPECAKSVIKHMSTDTTIPYYNITPTFSMCQNHGYSSGNVPVCLKCDRPNYVYSRVVGYIQPVQKWNPGKKSEFKDRKMYNLKPSEPIPYHLDKDGNVVVD